MSAFMSYLWQEAKSVLQQSLMLWTGQPHHRWFQSLLLQRGEMKCWTFQFLNSNYLPPGQSDLQVEKACTWKKGSHSISGLSSRNSQSSRKVGGHPAAIAASLSRQYSFVSASSSKWLMSVSGYFVVMFLTGHRQTGTTKFDVSSNAQLSYSLFL